MACKILIALLVVFVVIRVQLTEASSKHCTWHGTSPVCLPSCPSDKRVVMEDKCGKNKLFCCVTGTKKLCCPKSLGDINPAFAASIAH